MICSTAPTSGSLAIRSRVSQAILTPKTCGFACYGSSRKDGPLYLKCAMTIPAPLTKDELPGFMRDCDPTEGDENGPFLVKNKTGDILDRRNYGGWVAPEYGDG